MIEVAFDNVVSVAVGICETPKTVTGEWLNNSIDRGARTAIARCTGMLRCASSPRRAGRRRNAIVATDAGRPCNTELIQMTGTDSKMRGHPRKRGTSAEGKVNIKAATAAKRDVSELVAESWNPSRPQRFGSHRLDEIKLRRVLDYIAENLDQEITVAQLASVACLSPCHFASMFSRSIGVAPYRYVSQQRLESAKMMLADCKRSVSDIAFSCQFSSQTSFHRAFLREIGVTPGEYRRARVEERYLGPRADWVKVQKAQRHPCASRRDYWAPLSVRASLAIEDGSSEEALQNLPQYAAPTPEMVAATRNAEALVEASPALLWASLPNGMLDYFNPSCLAHFRLTSEGAQGYGWKSVIHHDDINVLVDAWQMSLKTGRALKALSRARCYDGQYHRIIIAANPVLDASGRIIKWSGTNLDLDNALVRTL
jgi:AraC-like DNA-binding protein